MIFLVIFFAWWAVAFIPVQYVNGKLFLKNYAGLTFAPFVFFKNERLTKQDWFVKHEMEHIRQQRVCSPAIFIVVYCSEYFLNRAKGMNHFDAYYSIGFEKMARIAEKE